MDGVDNMTTYPKVPVHYTIDMQANRVINVADPVEDTDAVTREWAYTEIYFAMEQELQRGAAQHLQAEPEALWIIEHGLSYYPKVMVTDLNGEVVSPGTVTQIDDNTLSIEFTPPLAGWAWLR
jgi:hypothetical protein